VGVCTVSALDVTFFPGACLKKEQPTAITPQHMMSPNHEVILVGYKNEWEQVDCSDLKQGESKTIHFNGQEATLTRTSKSSLRVGFSVLSFKTFSNGVIDTFEFGGGSEWLDYAMKNKQTLTVTHSSGGFTGIGGHSLNSASQVTWKNDARDSARD